MDDRMARSDEDVEITRVHEAIEAAVRSDQPGVMVTKWAVVIETLDDEGKNLTALRGPNTLAVPLWDVKGMFKEVLDDPDFFEPDDEDEV